MYKYTDDNSREDISLHDMRADRVMLCGNKLTFLFPNGFCVLAGNKNNSLNKLAAAERGELTLNCILKSAADCCDVYLYRNTEDESISMRESIGIERLCELINDNDCELEFLYRFRGYLSYIFKCWLWDKEDAYECEIIISAESEQYRFDTLHEITD